MRGFKKHTSQSTSSAHLFELLGRPQAGSPELLHDGGLRGGDLRGKSAESAPRERMAAKKCLHSGVVGSHGGWLTVLVSIEPGEHRRDW
eukprot:27860-Amorphochlora_amoeboformis.AAC.2